MLQTLRGEFNLWVPGKKTNRLWFSGIDSLYSTGVILEAETKYLIGLVFWASISWEWCRYFWSLSYLLRSQSERFAQAHSSSSVCSVCLVGLSEQLSVALTSKLTSNYNLYLFFKRPFKMSQFCTNRSVQTDTALPPQCYLFIFRNSEGQMGFLFLIPLLCY